VTYTPPGMPLDVTWQGAPAYTPPGMPLDVTWAPGTAPGDVLGTIASTTPPIIPLPVFSASGGVVTVAHAGTSTVPIIHPTAVVAAQRPDYSGDALWAQALHRPTAPSASVTCDIIATVAWGTDAPPVVLPPVFRGRERDYLADWASTAGPILVPPALTASADMVQPGTGSATTGPIIIALQWLSASLTQTIDLPEADGPGVREQAARQARHAAPLGARWDDMLRTQTPGYAAHQQGLLLPVSGTFPHADMLRARRSREVPHGHGIRLTRAIRDHAAHGIPARRMLGEQYAHGISVRRLTGTPHAEAIRRRQSLRLSEQDAIWAVLRLMSGHHAALPAATPLSGPYAQMIWPDPGWWGPRYAPPPLDGFLLVCAPGYTPRPLHCTILIPCGRAATQPYCPGVDPAPPGPGGPIIIPVLTRYFVINMFSLVRIADGAPIDVREFSASIDADSWTWGWSAQVHGDLLDLVRGQPGEPVELLAAINGIPLRVVVERISRDRRFAATWLRIAGRGRAAQLADPLAPVLQFSAASSRTVRQLLDDALTDNGVPIGWTVDWQTANWSVPGGVWSHTGTYMDAATRIAESAGAYVQGHDTDTALHILPRYPSLPWQWTTASVDLVLPEDVCSLEGIEWVDRPAYNAVWISGAEGGRRDRIRRAGSAADRYAPSVVDPLATHEDMTRARGAAILADTGRQAHITVRLPVLPETGIIKPGKLVRYNAQGSTHVGLTRAVSLEHRWPELWQTVRIETHEEAAP